MLLMPGNGANVKITVFKKKNIWKLWFMLHAIPVRKAFSSEATTNTAIQDCRF